MKYYRVSLLLIAIIYFGPFQLHAEQLDLERGVRVADLWCFPYQSNPKHYVYIPNKARLAVDEKKQPKFSFVRYIQNIASDSDGANTITEAKGGGILHFLVLYETPQSQVEQAQAALRKRLKDDKIELRGPIIFKAGRYALVSSIINPNETGKSGTKRHLLASGRAPVLEGNQIALSFDLDPEKATILLKSFNMTTPDISLVFDMTFEGLSAAYDAELLVDWTEVKKHKGYSAGGTVYFVSADVEAMFDELRRNNSIKLISRGSDAQMEGLLSTVYQKLLELMFKPVEPEKVPASNQGGIMDALSSMIDSKGGALSSRKTTGFGAYVGYQIKEMKSSGKSVLNFNHRRSVDRHSYITFNIGDFYKKYGNDKRYFRDINTNDATFQQREVRVSIDGALLPEFKRYINSATLTMRKTHESGKQTIREVVFNKNTIEKDPTKFRMLYGWDQDHDRNKWLNFQYRTRWNFKGGGQYQTDWQNTNAPMVDLFVPYERRNIQIMGNREELKKQGIRVVVVKIEYPFFGKNRKEQLIIRPDKKQDEWGMEITLPLGVYEYDYSISWIFEGNKRRTSNGKDSTGVLFVDEVPAT